MSKQNVLRAAMVGLCALTVGLAGCSSKPDAAPAPAAGAPAAVPSGVLDQIKNMPPEQQAKIREQMKNSPQGAQIQGAAQPNAPAGGQ